MAFSFGTATTSQPSLFGSTTTTQAGTTGFGGFGTTGGATTGSTGFGGLGTFGSTATTSASTGFGGFGLGTAATSSAPSLFSGFGTTTTSASPFTFNTATTSASTGFGFGTGTTGFGTGTTGTFGTGGAFGAPATNPLGGGCFGTQAAGAAAPGAPALSSEDAALAQVALAMSLPQIYGDERDATIAKWNQLQAHWGTGKGFYSQNGVVELKPDNPFCRFKALGYHLIPRGNNSLGHVALVLGRKEAQVTQHQQQVVDTLHKLLGSKPTLNVCVEGVKALPEDKTELVIYVLERPPTGPAKRVPANDLFNFLSQPTQKSQLASQLNVESLLPKVGWSKAQLSDYLSRPPAGVDPLLWQQAKLDNPDPDTYIPVAMVGFKELQRRLRHQAEQTRVYQSRMDVIAGDLASLQTQHSTMLSKLDDYKRKDLELGHRLLKVIAKQEVYRKLGQAIQVEEETLKVQLEQLQAELNHPSQFKGRLNEVMSQMRMQVGVGGGRAEQSFHMDGDTQLEVKTILKQQQEALQHLISVIKEDAADLALMEQASAKQHA